MSDPLITKTFLDNETIAREVADAVEYQSRIQYDSNIAAYTGQPGGPNGFFPLGMPVYSAIGPTHKLIDGANLTQALVALDKKWFTYARTLIFSSTSSTPNFTMYFGYPGKPTGATHLLVKAHAICGNINMVTSGTASTYAYVFVNGVRVMYIGATALQGEVVADNVMDIVPLWPSGYLQVHSAIPTGEVQVEIIGYLTE